ncbi:MAG TPA: hypothetical protein PKC49_02105, partial [Phycisphaerae bacterium]|nr:hypothetical protein [Phycisphaerae bacterium]
MPNPVLLLHGYSDRGDSFQKWKHVLVQSGFDARSVFVGNYKTLTNDITIKDLAEGLDRALRA